MLSSMCQVVTKLSVHFLHNLASYDLGMCHRPRRSAILLQSQGQLRLYPLDCEGTLLGEFETLNRFRLFVFVLPFLILPDGVFG